MFGLVVLGWVYGISTTGGYFMPNPIYTHKSKLAIAVEGDLKVLFSIATTLRCRGGR